MPFPLMVPTVIERSSWIDRERPIRLYRIDETGKHKAVRLTFRTGGGEYWGDRSRPTGTTRRSSPTNFTASIGGRATSSTTPARSCTWSCCAQGGATYWVVNTLLDSLSNETMLAIAKGLKPLAAQVR